MKSSFEFRPFTANDWFAFAGAESFPPARAGIYSARIEPLIADIRVDDAEGSILVDASGVSIIYGEIDPITINFVGPDALRALATLRPETTLATLRALGGIEL